MSNTRRSAFVALALALVWTSARAQNEKNNWIFGHHVYTTFGQSSYSGNPGIDSYEACSSISDAAGNLLFYTDGVSVWNKLDLVMPAAQATHLQGDTEGQVLIVPKPQSGCNEYFIFTTDSAFNSANQHPTLKYSVVKMNASTGNGLGDIDATAQNVLLQQNVSEQIAAVADGTGGYWVMAHGSGLHLAPNNDRFYSFHVTSSGITLGPQSQGIPHITGYDPVANAPYPAPWSATGQMKFSPDGTRIASAVPSKYVEVCNFNKTTGYVTGCAALKSDLGGPHAPFGSSLVYGIEFSYPLGKYLYVSTYVDPLIAGAYCQLVRFDLQTSGPGMVVASGNYNPNTMIGTSDMGDLQLAPDGQSIYLARQSSGLSVVHNLEAATPQFVPLASFAKPTYGTAWGLPNMVQGPLSCNTVSSPCPPNETMTTFNGITFCCFTSDDGQTCCHRLCPVGSTETFMNGATLCCATKSGSAIDANTAKFCCSKP